jgi:hypothetical protein
MLFKLLDINSNESQSLIITIIILIIILILILILTSIKWQHFLNIDSFIVQNFFYKID